MPVARRRRTRSRRSTDAMLARIAAINGQAAPVTPGRRKFHNTPTVYKGQRYDSLGEAEHAHVLDQKLAKGEIIHWERPKAIVLVDAPRARERVTFKPDFWVIPADRPGNLSAESYVYSYYEDYKGSTATETAAWKLKMRLWRARVPFELRVVYADGSHKVVATGEVAA